MLYKFEKQTYSSKCDKEELLKRLKSITQEPDDINKKVPKRIYKFYGKIIPENINIIFSLAPYTGSLELKIKIVQDESTKIIVDYRVSRAGRTGFYFIFLLFIVSAILMFFEANSFYLFLRALTLTVLFFGIPTFIGYNFLNYSAPKKLTKTFAYLSGDKFDYSKTKYKYE